MDFMFYAIPALIAGVAFFAAAKAVHRLHHLRAAWTSGVTAEARCLRAFTTVHRNDNNTSTQQHHVYEYATQTGRTVRFEESGGSTLTVEGDIVVVHYSPDAPERATALPPGQVKAIGGTVALLAFLGVIIAFCVVFVSSFQSFRSDW